MKRAAGLLLALLAFPLGAESQQVPGGSDQTHLVSSGETLGSIAQRYYGSAAEWPTIFEANRGLLDDPDILEPGTSLAIPGASGGSAQVVDVQFRGGSPQAQDVMSPRDRRALLETTTFAPSGEPFVPDADRTVFFEFEPAVEGAPPTDPEAAEAAEDEALLGPPAVPQGFLLEAGWIVPAGAPVGEVGSVLRVLNGASVAGAEVSAELYGQVRIQGAPGATFQVGERYQSFALGAPEDGVGRIAVPSGILEVTESGGEVATARVIQLFGRVGPGELLTPMVASPLAPGEYPIETDLAVAGRLVALQQRAELYLPKLYAFADLGSDAGIRIGDEFVGVADDVPEWSSETLARFQVVDVRDSSSTLLVVSTIAPRDVKPGMRVVLDRRMP